MTGNPKKTTWFYHQAPCSQLFCKIEISKKNRNKTRTYFNINRNSFFCFLGIKVFLLPNF